MSTEHNHPSSACNHPEVLGRTLEPELMDSDREVEEYLEMDHSTVNDAFVTDLLAGGEVGARVIDLGCGTADIPILLCQRCPEVDVLAIDASIPMLEAAKIEIELGGVAGRVTLQHDDCKNLMQYEPDMADVVMSNTVAHHLPDPKCLLQQAVHLVRPGGRVFFRDLFRPANEARIEELVREHAGDESEYAQQLFRQSLHAALSESEWRQNPFHLRHPRQKRLTDKRPALDAGLDQACRLKPRPRRIEVAQFANPLRQQDSSRSYA